MGGHGRRIGLCGLRMDVRVLMDVRGLRADACVLMDACVLRVGRLAGGTLAF